MMPKVLSSEEGGFKFKKSLRSLKKLPSVIFVLLIAIGVPVGLYLVSKVTQLRTGAAPGNTVLSVLPLTATLGVGETSDMTVWINPSTDAISGLQLVMTYDPAVIQILDVTPSSFFTEPASQIGQPTVLIKDLSTPGQIIYAIGFPLNANQYTSSAVAEAVKITVKGLAQGSTQMSFGTIGGAVNKTTDSSGANLLKTATGNTVNVSGGVRLLYGTPTPNNPEKIGTTFTLPVILNTSGQNVDGVDAIVRFDPAVFSVTNVAQNTSSGFSSFPSLSVNNTAGTVTISGNVGSGTTVTPVNGTVTIATLTVNPKALTAASQFTFDFTAGSRNDSNVLGHVTQSGQEPQDILAAVSPASIVVSNATVTASPTATPLPTQTPTPSPKPSASSSPIGTTNPGVGSPTPTPTPTLAPTATPSPSPVAQSVTFSLKLQGRTRSGAVLPPSVTLSYRKAGSAASTATTVSLTPNTSAQVVGSILPGNYVFLVKAPGYLARRFGSDSSPVVIATSTSSLDFTTATLLGGDFNGDGIVNEVDYTLNFLTSFASANSLVDLDGSGQVNNLDYGVMRSNWSLSGDSL